ncbi:MAG: LysR family transcriptional regulator [Acidobacteriaceae bacterium]|nr:LysR family transcriptional regulator [Acidobacteriaceae bacterium]
MYEWAEFRHFRYLLAVLELQGFRAAAEQLHTAQPNLSSHAKQFQEYGSVRLYEKGKDGRIKATETGVAFQFIAKSLLEARDETFAALAAVERGEISSVRFGCSPLADQTLFNQFCQMHRDMLPGCRVRPERDDTAQLIERVIDGVLDAAIVTLPVLNDTLRVEELCRDRLVACLRADDPLCEKGALQPADLREHLAVLYHPQRHPNAHQKLLELLADAGVQVEEYSKASHPTEMQTLVRDGYGIALMREGAPLEPELTTRPIAGVRWTVDTAVIYRKQHQQKTIPVLVRKFKRHLRRDRRPAENILQDLAQKQPFATPIQLGLLE